MRVLSEIDTASQPTADSIVDLSLRYLHGLAAVRLTYRDQPLDWTADSLRLTMGREIDLLDYLTLVGFDNIVARLIDYHATVERGKIAVDFPRPMGAKL